MNMRARNNPPVAPPVQPSESMQAEAILRIDGAQSPESIQDLLAVEEPLEIRMNNTALLTTMRTPGEDQELAAGLLYTEGILQDPDQVLHIHTHPHNRFGNILNVFLSPGVEVDWQRIGRLVYSNSSCGLCGKRTIDSILQTNLPLQATPMMDAGVLHRLPEAMRRAQRTFAGTGGLHAAALFNSQGRLLFLSEDIGRHNAVDKIVGTLFLRRQLPQATQAILLVSGRASFEIVQKAVAARIPVVAAISAPSLLALQLARESGITLIGFLRDQRMNVYSHPERIRFQEIAKEKQSRT